MPVVSNTSPILSLAAVDYLDLLHEQFGKILIPEIVQTELRMDTDFRGTWIQQLEKRGCVVFV